MSLFPKWQGKLRLPALPERRLSVGRNALLQRVFLGAEIKASISDSQCQGHDLVRTSLEVPPVRLAPGCKLKMRQLQVSGVRAEA